MATQRERRPLAPATKTSDKRRAGKTAAPDTQVEIRSGGNHVDDALRQWIHERMGRQLGKYARQIERAVVRFGDVNGPKGGVTKSCLIELSMSALPNVVVQELGETERKAFDFTMRKAERTTRRNLERHGFSVRPGLAAPSAEPGEEEITEAEEEGVETRRGPLMGAKVGHAQQNLLDVRAQKRVDVDTTAPGQSASGRRAGRGHTAARNTKITTAGLSYALEDSTAERPSRKSTRRSTNRVKPDNNLTRRTKRAVQSPQSRAARHA